MRYSRDRDEPSDKTKPNASRCASDARTLGLVSLLRSDNIRAELSPPVRESSRNTLTLAAFEKTELRGWRAKLCVIARTANTLVKFIFRLLNKLYDRKAYLTRPLVQAPLDTDRKLTLT